MDTNLQWLISKLTHKRFIAIACVICCMATSLIMTGLDFSSNTVYLYDSAQGEEPQIISTKHTDLQKLLDDKNVTVSEYDEVSFTDFENGKATITITRAFAVSVMADGKQTQLMMTSGTVADALEKAGITVSDDDLINLALTEQVNSQTEIKINRVTYKQTEKLENIPFETKTNNTDKLQKGTTKISVKGQNGQTKSVFKQTYIDGVLTETEFVSKTVVKEPVTQIKLVGTAAVKKAASVSVFSKNAISKLTPPANFQLDSNGIPVNYSKVLTGLAKAYSASAGARTSTGRPAMVGHVAVNPKIIPYGTKMYIVSTDGKVVYGYCIAADTGGSLRKNQIIADLYYDTDAQCRSFGARDVNIYILD